MIVSIDRLFFAVENKPSFDILHRKKRKEKTQMAN
jgi:hypothetical protein